MCETSLVTMTKWPVRLDWPIRLRHESSSRRFQLSRHRARPRFPRAERVPFSPSEFQDSIMNASRSKFQPIGYYCYGKAVRIRHSSERDWLAASIPIKGPHTSAEKQRASGPVGIDPAQGRALRWCRTRSFARRLCVSCAAIR